MTTYILSEVSLTKMQFLTKKEIAPKKKKPIYTVLFYRENKYTKWIKTLPITFISEPVKYENILKEYTEAEFLKKYFKTLFLHKISC